MSTVPSNFNHIWVKPTRNPIKYDRNVPAKLWDEYQQFLHMYRITNMEGDELVLFSQKIDRLEEEIRSYYPILSVASLRSDDTSMITSEGPSQGEEVPPTTTIWDVFAYHQDLDEQQTQKYEQERRRRPDRDIP